MVINLLEDMSENRWWIKIVLSAFGKTFIQLSRQDFQEEKSEKLIN